MQREPRSDTSGGVRRRRGAAVRAHPDALAAAEAEPDPGSLGAGTRLRARFGPDLAAAALTQVTLRRKARTKFGEAAAGLFFTRDGLEQATRPDVADLHARRFVDAGVRRVVDLGCGIGSDAAAFVRAGLDVARRGTRPGDRRRRPGEPGRRRRAGRRRGARRGRGGRRRRRAGRRRRPRRRASSPTPPGATPAAGCGGRRTSAPTSPRCSRSPTAAGSWGSSWARRCRTRWSPPTRRPSGSATPATSSRSGSGAVRAACPAGAAPCSGPTDRLVGGPAPSTSARPGPTCTSRTARSSARARWGCSARGWGPGCSTRRSPT